MTPAARRGLLVCAVALSACGSSVAQTSVIRRITFVGNRTHESVLRRHLPFKEGDPLGSESIEEAYQALYDLRLFKHVEVSSSSYQDGSEVTVKLKDGWYAIPFPFFTAGAGGGRGGLFLSSRNVFRRAESLNFAGMLGAEGGRGSFSALWEGWSIETGYGKREFVERQYRDGAFSSTSGFGKPRDSAEPERFGPTENSYKKSSEEGSFALGVPLGRPRGGKRRLSVRLGWRPALIRYSDIASVSPGGDGHLGEAFIGLRVSDGSGGGFGGDGLGALLGFGLADLDRRLKPLPRMQRRLSAGVALNRADRWSNSDIPYTHASANARYSISWGLHNNLSLGASLASGRGLPPSRLLATSDVGLTGSYAREYRGSTALGSNVSFSKPLRSTRRGVWQAGAFFEAATAWRSDRPGSKRGVGGSFSYRFWRFPLPLGLSYTYSLDDSDSQVTGAIGGRF